MSTDLLSLNVSDHIEKKGGLSYLSWAWAWAEVLKNDPAATWAVVTYDLPDGTRTPCMWIGETAMVVTRVTIKGIERFCHLAVMDNKNNAVKNPDARKISDAIMRCMVKAIAMHGLGLYIYAGEDLPEAAADHEQEARAKRGAELEELALFLIDCHQHEKDMDAIRLWYAADTWSGDNATQQEEKEYVWGLLKSVSKLRSTIKSNHPERLAQKEAA